MSPREHRVDLDESRIIDVGRLDADVDRIIDVRSLDLGGDVVIVADLDGRIIDVNDAFVEATGYSRREAIGQSPAMLSSGYQDPTFYAELWRTVTGGDVWHGELIDRRRDGALRTYQATISPVKDTAGRVTHLVAVERDLTRDLARQGQLGSTGLVHTDLAGSCVYADERAADLLGARVTDLLGRGLADRLDPDDAAQLREVVQLAAEEGRGHRLEVRPRTGDALLHIELVPLTVPSGAVIGAAVSLEDRSEQFATRRELLRRDALLTSVLDALPDPMAVVDADGALLAVNAPWRRGAGGDGTAALFAADVGDDIEAVARRAADEGDQEARRLLAGIRSLRTTGRDTRPTETGDDTPAAGFTVTPLAWDEGGYILRRTG